MGKMIHEYNILVEDLGVDRRIISKWILEMTPHLSRNRNYGTESWGSIKGGTS
jgi:hypothetical protein